MITWPEKDMAEAFAVGFDYAGELETGETISSATVSVVVLAGDDPNPAAILSGPAQLGTDNVLQTVQDGLDDTIYGLKCVATTTAGRKLTRAAHLPVMDATRW